MQSAVQEDDLDSAVNKFSKYRKAKQNQANQLATLYPESTSGAIFS